MSLDLHILHRRITIHAKKRSLDLYLYIIELPCNQIKGHTITQYIFKL